VIDLRAPKPDCFFLAAKTVIGGAEVRIYTNNQGMNVHYIDVRAPDYWFSFMQEYQLDETATLTYGNIEQTVGKYLLLCAMREYQQLIAEGRRVN
jgi:hypothetical protein